MTVIRLFTNFSLSPDEFSIYKSQIQGVIPEAEVVANRSGAADLCVVLNFSRGIRFAWGKNLRVIKLLQEPTVEKSIFHLFTKRHSRIFWRVFAHNADEHNGMEVVSPPLLANHLGATPFAHHEKSKNLSAIASTISDLPGHRSRNDFIKLLEASGVDFDLFGKGRREIDAKILGLGDYRFSVAIENSSQPNYWTEKITDCFMSSTIPVYFGAPNIFDFFPRDSIVWVDIEKEPSFALDTIRSLDEAEYLRRLPALREAQELLKTQYHLGKLVQNALSSSDERSPSFVIKRLFTIDSAIQLAFEGIMAPMRWLRLLK